MVIQKSRKTPPKFGGNNQPVRDKSDGQLCPQRCTSTPGRTGITMLGKTTALTLRHELKQYKNYSMPEIMDLIFQCLTQDDAEN